MGAVSTRFFKLYRLPLLKVQRDSSRMIYGQNKRLWGYSAPQRGAYFVTMTIWRMPNSAWLWPLPDVSGRLQTTAYVPGFRS